MKIAKVLLYIILINNSGAYSNEYVFDANVDVFEVIQLNSQAKWALDGGIFKGGSEKLNLKNNGDYSLLILEANGELITHKITIKNGENIAITPLNTIVIDNVAPSLSYSWENVIDQESQVIVGPKSRLSWQTNDSSPLVRVYINDEVKDVSGNSILMAHDILKITIQTTDAYSNQASTNIPFVSKFISPSLSWALKEPSINQNNQWYAKKLAILELLPNQGVSYSVNGKSLPNRVREVQVTNNSKVVAEDSIGNQTTENISWIEGNLLPQLSVVTLNESYINPKKLQVKVGQKIFIESKDKIFGIQDSSYFGNNREWIPMPKAFVFVDTGLYRLKIKSNNKLGNDLVSEIVFKIIK